MIKTYDEALKILNDVRTYLAISRADDCVQELDKVARYFINEKHKENPTLSECIKEWESRGYEVRENTEFHILFRHTVNDNVVEIFKSNLSYMSYQYYDDRTILSIPFDLHNLIHKTLKALEVENECKE